MLLSVLYTFSDFTLTVKKKEKKTYGGSLMDDGRTPPVLKERNTGFWKEQYPLGVNQQMMQDRQLKVQAGAPAEASLLPDERSFPCGLVDVQHLLTVCRRADNTKSYRAIISIIHVCSGVPRLKAASRVTHDFTLAQSVSLLLCCPPNPVLLHSYGFVANFRGHKRKASHF